MDAQYPNSIVKRRLSPRHLGEEWLIGYKNIIERRLDAKKKYKETKDSKYQSLQEAYKLSLNGGGFGKLNEENSWQFDPKAAMSVTIGNQIEILMLIEKLEINNIHVISANTDGIVSLFNKSDINKYYCLCKEWEVFVGNDIMGQLEYTEYKKIIQTSVNDYLAIGIDNKIKKKGDFVTEFELHKNKSKRVIPLALEQYYLNGIKPEEFIKSHKNIFDFCLGAKSKGKMSFIALDKKTGNEDILQRINRYYISNTGIHLLKRLPPLEDKKISNQIDIFGSIDDGTREHEVESGWLSTIYNTHIQKDIKDYNINYNFYIEGAYKIINQIK